MYHKARSSRSSPRQSVPARMSGVRFSKRKQVFDIANVALISRAAGAIHARDLRARNFSPRADTRTHGCVHLLHAPPLFIFCDHIRKNLSFAYVTARRSNREFVGQIVRNSKLSRGCWTHMTDCLNFRNRQWVFYEKILN